MSTTINKELEALSETIKDSIQFSKIMRQEITELKTENERLKEALQIALKELQHCSEYAGLLSTSEAIIDIERLLKEE